MRPLMLVLWLISDFGLGFAQDRLPAIGHIVHMGQSLGAGDQSLPVVSDMPSSYCNLMFSMGVHTWTGHYFPDQPHLRASYLFDFDLLSARQRGREGETIANGLCDNLRYNLLKSNDGNTVPQFLFTYAGEGGRYLRELNKRHDDAKDERAGRRKSAGGYYKTAVDDVRRAKAVADSMLMAYSVFAITWMQGEANNSGKLNRWDPALDRGDFLTAYSNDLITLKKDFQDDIVAITNQQTKPSLFTYQTAGVMSGTAQLMACDQEQDMFMVGPTYMLPNAENSYYQVNDKWFYGDGIHLTADGERWLGEQFGKVIRRVMKEGNTWQPLRPTSAQYLAETKSVIIGFHLPSPPLVIDTVFLPAQGSSFGFSVYDDQGFEYVVDAVNLVSDTSLILSLADTPVEGTPIFLSYGLNSFVSEVSKPIYNTICSDGDDYCEERISVVFEGNILREFSKFLEEGSFHLFNHSIDQGPKASLIVRDVSLDDHGNTVLTGNTCDLKDGSFEKGQACHVSRRYAFGNIRDSDDEESLYTFQESGHGARVGRNYPLWNWCVAFTDFQIK